MDREEVLKKARELGRSLRDSDEYRELLDAERMLDEDKETQEMLNEFDAKRKEIEIKQMMGEDISKEIEEINEMEKKIMERESMERYSKAEENFKKLLDDVNREIVKGMEEDS